MQVELLPLLLGVSPAFISADIVQSLENLARSLLHNEPLHKLLYHHIVAEFGIWTRCPSNVQMAVIKMITNHVTQRVSYFRSVVTVQILMDVCRTFYQMGGASGGATSTGVGSQGTPTTAPTLSVMAASTSSGNNTNSNTALSVPVTREENNNATTTTSSTTTTTGSSTRAKLSTKETRGLRPRGAGLCVPHDPGLLQQNSELRLWDSLTKWIKHVEEYLFYNSTPTLPASPASTRVTHLLDEPIPNNNNNNNQGGAASDVLGINRDAFGKWTDFQFAQQLGAFLQVLGVRAKTLATSSNSTQAAALMRYCNVYSRVELNIVLATLHEADPLDCAAKR